MDLIIWIRYEIFGMQLSEFNEIRVGIRRKIKEIFGNRNSRNI